MQEAVFPRKEGEMHRANTNANSRMPTMAPMAEPAAFPSLEEVAAGLAAGVWVWVVVLEGNGVPLPLPPPPPLLLLLVEEEVELGVPVGEVLGVVTWKEEEEEGEMVGVAVGDVVGLVVLRAGTPVEGVTLGVRVGDSVALGFGVGDGVGVGSVEEEEKEVARVIRKVEPGRLASATKEPDGHWVVGLPWEGNRVLLLSPDTRARKAWGVDAPPQLSVEATERA